MSDPLDFLDPTQTAPAPESSPPPASTQPMPEAPAPLDIGAPSELPTVTVAPPPIPMPAPPPVAEPQRVPLAELLNEREKRQAVEQRERQTQEAYQLLLRQMQQNAAPPPDIFQNPQDYLQQSVIAPVQQQMAAMRSAMSQRFAEMQHGAPVVTEAMKALQSHPEGPRLAASLDQDPDPYGKLVEWHKREKLFSEAGTDPDAWVIRRYQELAAKQAQAQGLPPAPAHQSMQPFARPQAPPPSLASIPASGGSPSPGQHAPMSPADRFNATFAR